jgi:hypothetical protein
VGLSMLPLSRFDPLWPEFPPFMLDVLEVVDSPAESPKFVATQNEQRLEAPARNCKNWMVWFGKPDCLVLSGPSAVRGVVGLWQGAPPLAKRHLDGGEAWTMTTLEVVVAAKRFNWRKMKRIEN